MLPGFHHEFVKWLGDDFVGKTNKSTFSKFTNSNILLTFPLITFFIYSF